MMPFLKPKAVAGLIVAHRKLNGNMELNLPDQVGGREDDGLRAASEDLIRAIHGKDREAVMEALRAAFQLLDSDPHVEGPHENPEVKE